MSSIDQAGPTVSAAGDNLRGGISPDAAAPEILSALLSAVLAETAAGVLVMGADGSVVTLNHNFAEMWRLDLQAATDPATGELQEHVWLKQAIERLADPDAFLARVQELYADPSQRDHCELGFVDGRTLERQSAALWGADGEYIGRVWFFTDITERKQREQELTDLAGTDDLTGAANRRRFTVAVGEAFLRARASGTPLSIVSFDLDGFKTTNDAHGHAAGDAMLAGCVAAWRNCVRADDLVARLGGDEFAILMDGADIDAAAACGRRLLAATRELQIGVGRRTLGTTISVGVASLEPDDESISQLIARADSALYVAKRSGRDQLHIGPDMTGVSR